MKKRLGQTLGGQYFCRGSWLNTELRSFPPMRGVQHDVSIFLYTEILVVLDRIRKNLQDLLRGEKFS